MNRINRMNKINCQVVGKLNLKVLCSHLFTPLKFLLLREKHFSTTGIYKLFLFAHIIQTVFKFCIFYLSLLTLYVHVLKLPGDIIL